MSKKENSVLVEYFKECKKEIFQKILFFSIFFMVFFLYNLPLEAWIYAGVICLFVDGIWNGISYYQYKKKYDNLKRMKKQNNLIQFELGETKGKIEELYQQLLQKVWNEQQQLLYQNDEEKTEVLDYYTMWVHQIKTPIARMYLLLQEVEFICKKEVEIALFEIEQYVEMVLQSLRLFSDSTDLVLRRYSLEDIIKQAVRKYAKVFIGKKITLNFKSCPMEVLTDEKWLLFVIEQLLSNALKYTKSGSISIYLDETKENTLVIEDTGIGIREEDLPRVFEKGFTGYNGRENKKSTGIGLYLCKRVLEKLSHKITMESEVGIGTKIKLDLSCLDVENRYE